MIEFSSPESCPIFFFLSEDRFNAKSAATKEEKSEKELRALRKKNSAPVRQER
jgi:hypothetical protein